MNEDLNHSQEKKTLSRLEAVIFVSIQGLHYFVPSMYRLALRSACLPAQSTSDTGEPVATPTITANHSQEKKTLSCLEAVIFVSIQGVHYFVPSMRRLALRSACLPAPAPTKSTSDPGEAVATPTITANHSQETKILPRLAVVQATKSTSDPTSLGQAAPTPTSTTSSVVANPATMYPDDLNGFYAKARPTKNDSAIAPTVGTLSPPMFPDAVEAVNRNCKSSFITGNY